MIKDPYETTFGSVISTGKIKEQLVRYYSLNDINMYNYEYVNKGDVKLAYLTGYIEDEKDIPIFDHPLIVTDIKGNTIVVTDLRKYVTVKNEQPINLNDIVKDKTGYEFVILRSLLTRDLYNEEIGLHRITFKGVSSGFSVWISTVINNIVGLDPIEKVNVEVVANLYANIMTIDEEEVPSMIDSIKARVSKAKYSIRLTNKMIQDILNNIDYNMFDLNTFINVISGVIDDNKSSLVTIDSFVNVIGNGWYGPGNNETLIIATEHFPTLATLVYANLENKGFKRTQLASMLTKNKNNIDGNTIIKHYDNYLKDSIV